MSSFQCKSARVGFLFSPQNSHYVGMGKELYDTFPIFAQAMDTCDALYINLTSKSLKTLIWNDDENIDDPTISGPGIFTMEYALLQLLKAFNVTPYIILGHSFGEYCAAVSAGVLSVEEAMLLVVRRAEAVKAKVEEGRLTAVRANINQIHNLLLEFHSLHAENWIDLASVNAPESIAVGGSLKSIEKFEEMCNSKKVEYMRLSASAPYAYHTRAMKSIREELLKLTSTFAPLPPQYKFVSCITGKELQVDDFTPEYWYGLSRNPLHFDEAMNYFLRNCDVVIEIGPAAIIQGLIKQNMIGLETQPLTLELLLKDKNKSQCIIDCLCELKLNDVNVNWNAWFNRKKIEKESSKNVEEGTKCVDMEIDQPTPTCSVYETESIKLKEFEVEIEVKAVSLNYVDKRIIQSSDTIGPNFNKIGFDISGIVKNKGIGVMKMNIGDHIYGINVNGGSLCNSVKVNEKYIREIPSGLNFESAATTPLTYIIAWKALVEIGGIGNEDRVFINYARGWVGIALANIALYYGAEVFALAGNEERKEYLESLRIQHIYNIHDVDYLDKILEDTNGQGLTLVVNSFEDAEMRRMSLKLSAENGKFIDISNTGNLFPEYSEYMKRNVSYVSVDILAESLDQIASIWSKISEKFQEGILPPFPSKVFPLEVVTNVIDWFEEGKLGRGKPVLQISQY